MIRLLIYFLIAWVVYRVLRSILLPAPRAKSVRRPASRRRHASDFSDVQEADFEDLTPPPPSQDARKTGT